MRSRLAKAVDGTLALFRNARESDLARQVAPVLFDERRDLPAARFATRADVARYGRQRPWVQLYLLLLSMDHRTAGLTNAVWPRAEDAPRLRELLSDPDPAIRGLAAEALGTLQDPDDVPRLGKLLSDATESVQALGWNQMLSAHLALPSESGGKDDGALDIGRSWQPRRVGAYARAALRLMTGQDLSAQKFEAWWARNRGGRERIWYWQERLHRDLTVAAAAEWPTWREADGDYAAWLSRRLKDRESRFAAVRRAVGKELEQLPVEVEVKVRLLAVNRYSSSLGSELDEPLIGPFECRRVSSERLLELLERKNLWVDVDWDTGAYNTLVVQVAGQAERFFARKDAERLRMVQARERELWWNGQAAFCIGISRLLPVAPPGHLDDPETRDGVLRAGVRTVTDVFARGALARELVRTGLPANWEFLAGQFFSESSRSAVPDLRASVLEELGSPPATEVKRDALVRLLLDPRFDALWTEASAAAGDDQHRVCALRAVNALAGREVLTSQHDARLRDAAHAAEALNEVKGIVRKTLITEPGSQAIR